MPNFYENAMDRLPKVLKDCLITQFRQNDILLSKFLWLNYKELVKCIWFNGINKITTPTSDFNFSRAVDLR